MTRLPRRGDRNPPKKPGPEALFAAALAHHQAGRLAEAEPLYRQVLASHPDHADTLNLLGLAAIQSGRGALAIPLLGRAIAVNPTAGQYHSNLGMALAGAGGSMRLSPRSAARWSCNPICRRPRTISAWG